MIISNFTSELGGAPFLFCHTSVRFSARYVVVLVFDKVYIACSIGVSNIMSDIEIISVGSETSSDVEEIHSNLKRFVTIYNLKFLWFPDFIVLLCLMTAHSVVL